MPRDPWSPMSPLERITEETLPPDIEEISRLMPDMPRGLGILRQTLALLPNPLQAFVRQSLPADEISAPGQGSDALAGGGIGMTSPAELPPGTIQQQTPPRSPMNLFLTLEDLWSVNIGLYALEVGPLIFNGATFESWHRDTVGGGLQGEWSEDPIVANAWNEISGWDPGDSTYTGIELVDAETGVVWIRTGGKAVGTQPYSRWPETRPSTGKPSGPYPWDDPTWVFETTFMMRFLSRLTFTWADLKYYNPSGNWLDSILNVIVNSAGSWSLFDDFNRVVASDGLGVASSGALWTKLGGSSTASVDGTQAVIVTSGTFTQYEAPYVGSGKTRMKWRFKTPAAIPAGTNYVSVTGSFIANNTNGSQLFITIGSGSSGEIQVNSVFGGVGSPGNLAKTDWLPDTWYAAALEYEPGVRTRARVWLDSDPEPATWDVTSTLTSSHEVQAIRIQTSKSLALGATTTYRDDLYTATGYTGTDPSDGEVSMDRGEDSTYPDAVTPGDVGSVAGGLVLGSLYHLRVEFDKEVGAKAYVWLDGDPQPSTPTVELAHPFFRSPGHQPNAGQPSPMIHVGTSDGVTADYDTIDNAPYAPNGIRVFASGIDWTRLVTQAPAEGAWRFTTIPESGMDIAYQIIGADNA